MDISIEKIIGTLFAGSLAGSVVIILAFLLTAFNPSKSLKFWLQRTFYRSPPGTVNDIDTPSIGDLSKWFFGLTMVAIIYSFGVAVEHLSDRWTDNSKQFIFWIPFRPVAGDAMIRAKAFVRVYNPEIRKGLSKEESDLSRKVKKCLKNIEVKLSSNECEALIDRVNVKYYHAKNVVYRDNNYFTELQGIQRRIDFVRTLTFTSTILIISFIIGILVSCIPYLSKKESHSNNPFFQHWEKLHKKRLFSFIVLIIIAWFLSIFAWEHEEYQFDLRSFGYYLDAFVSQKTISGVSTNNPDTKISYTTFGRYRKFEPSGVSRIGKTSYFIVINDKNKTPPFSLFELTEQGRLLEIAQFEIRTQDKQIDVFKLEAITASRKNSGTFYAITAFDRDESKFPGSRKLILFKLDNTHNLIDFEELKLYDPGKMVSMELKREWSKVEALALSPEEEYLFIGVRAIGESYKSSSYKVIILKYTLNDLNKKPEILVNVDLQDYLQRSEGISSLEFSHELNKFLLLTSFEDNTEPILKDQVGGHLWIVPRELSRLNSLVQWKTFKRIAFIHKPEGVEALSARKAIVVFDDDDDRKSIEGVGGKFRLASNEAVFSVVDLSR